MGRMPLVPLAANAALVKQAIKTAVAAVACLYITNLLNLPQGYWGAITALIVMQSSVGATVSASRMRLAGTAVGALLGGAFVAAWGNSVPLFGVAVALAFFLCSALGLAESQRLATVTVAIVMLIGGDGSPWMVALHRFLEVAVGIVIALVVSVVLWPSRARQSLLEGMAETLRKAEAFYRAAGQSYRNGLLLPSGELKPAVDASFRRNEDLLENAREETLGLGRSHESLALLMDRIRGIVQAVESLNVSGQGNPHDTYIRAFDSEMDRVEADLSAAFEWLAVSIANSGAAAPSSAGREPDSSWPNLTASVAALETTIVTARNKGVTAAHQFDEVLRLYSFFVSVKSVAQELERTHAFLESPLRAAA
jgi:hypothetical protein